jgi:hypothetical protein
MNVKGKGGLTLRKHWEAGPRTYLGLQVQAFPNMFTITGPGSPSVLSNMLCSIEQHVDWIADCITHMRDNGIETIETTTTAEDEWVAHVNEVRTTRTHPSLASHHLRYHSLLFNRLLVRIRSKQHRPVPLGILVRIFQANRGSSCHMLQESANTD